MPWEIGEFRHQVRLHRLTMINLSKDELSNITLIPTLNLNDDIIDWSNSKLSKEYYIEHFKISCKTLEDIINIKPRIGNITSTTDALKKNIDDILTDDDFYLWIDPDISYPYTYWNSIIETLNIVKDKSEYFIISPSTTKLWDSSWDVLVDSSQINLPYGDEGWYNSDFEKYFYLDSPNISYTPYIKFGGGFGNLFSANILRLFGIPEEYVLYGGVDTYIMKGADVLNKQGKLIQYKLENLITIQDFKFSDKEMYKNFTPILLNKDKQRELNEKINNIYQKSTKELLNKLK